MPLNSQARKLAIHRAESFWIQSQGAHCILITSFLLKFLFTVPQMTVINEITIPFFKEKSQKLILDLESLQINKMYFVIICPLSKPVNKPMASPQCNLEIQFCCLCRRNLNRHSDITTVRSQQFTVTILIEYKDITYKSSMTIPVSSFSFNFWIFIGYLGIWYIKRAKEKLYYH